MWKSLKMGFVGFTEFTKFIMLVFLGIFAIAEIGTIFTGNIRAILSILLWAAVPATCIIAIRILVPKQWVTEYKVARNAIYLLDEIVSDREEDKA